MAKVGRRFGKRMPSRNRGVQTVRVFAKVRRFLETGIARPLRITPRRRLVLSRSLVALARVTRTAYLQEAMAPTEREVVKHIKAIKKHAGALIELIGTHRRTDVDEAHADAAWSDLMTSSTFAAVSPVPDRQALSMQLQFVILACETARRAPKTGKSPVSLGFTRFITELADRYRKLRPVAAGGSKGTSERGHEFVTLAWLAWQLVDDVDRLQPSTFGERMAGVIYGRRVSKREKKPPR